MPYIKRWERPCIDASIERLDDHIDNVGQLNYAITRLALRYINRNGLNYTTLAGVVGTMILATLELVRRLVSRYEDCKIRENGDVDDYGALLFPRPNPLLNAEHDGEGFGN